MIGFSEGQYTAMESSGTATICFDMIRASQRRVEVSVSGLDTESQDFALPAETDLEFMSGQTQICTEILINDDEIVEGPESYMVVVTTSDPAVDIFRMRSLLTIADNDRESAVIAKFKNYLYTLVYCFLF